MKPEVDPARFYRCFALVPVLLAALAWALVWAFPESRPDALDSFVFLFGISVVGLPVYVPFAALIDWLLRRRPPESHRNWSYWVPLPFAALVFVFWFAAVVPDLPLARRAQSSLGAACFGAGFGYFYVVLMHASFAVGRLLGLIRPWPAAA